MSLGSCIGLLFLGGGRYSLSNTPFSIACLLISLYPRTPFTPDDHRVHCQAFRHLWVCAAEERGIKTVDVDTGKQCYVSFTQMALFHGASIHAWCLNLWASTVIVGSFCCLLLSAHLTLRRTYCLYS